MQQTKNFLFEYKSPKTVKLAEIIPSLGGGFGTLKEIQSLDHFIQELSASPEQEIFLVEFVENYGSIEENGWSFQRKTYYDISNLLGNFKKWFDIELYREQRNPNLIAEQRLNIEGETYKIKIEKTSGIVEDEQTISIALHTGSSISDVSAKGFDATVSIQGLLYSMTSYNGDGSCSLVTRANLRDTIKQYQPHLEQIDRILKEHLIFENSPFNLPLENRIYQG